MFGIIEAIKSGVVLATSISKISSITKAVNIAALTLISSVVFNPKEQTQTEAASPLVRANISEYVDIINNISSLVLNMSQGIGFGLSGYDMYRKYGNSIDVDDRTVYCQCPYEHIDRYYWNNYIKRVYVANMTIAQCIICTKAIFYRLLTYPTFLSIEGVQQFDRNNKTLLSPNNTMIVIQEGNVANALRGDVYLRSFPTFAKQNVIHNSSQYKFARTPEPMQYMLMLNKDYTQIAVIDMLNKDCSGTSSQSGFEGVTRSNFERGYGMGRVMSIVNITKYKNTLNSHRFGVSRYESFSSKPIAHCVFLDNQEWKTCLPKLRPTTNYYGLTRGISQSSQNIHIYEQYVKLDATDYRYSPRDYMFVPPSLQVALAHTVFQLLKYICIANTYTTGKSEEYIVNYCLKAHRLGGTAPVYAIPLNISEPILCNNGSATYPYSDALAFKANLKPCW